MKSIRDLRLQKNLTQLELGRMLGVTFTTVSKLENEKILPSPKLAEKLANVFACKPTDFEMPKETQMIAKRNKKTYINQGLNPRSAITKNEYFACVDEALENFPEDKKNLLLDFSEKLRERIF